MPSETSGSHDRSIVYCDRCAKMIRPSADPKAIVTSEQSFCGSCVGTMSNETREQLIAKIHPERHKKERPPEARRQPTRSHQRHSHTRPEGPGKPSNKVLYIALGVGALVGLAAAAVILSSGDPPPSAPKVAAPVRHAPTTPARPVMPDPAPEPPGPVADPMPSSDTTARLRAIREEIATSIHNYAERRAELERIATASPGTPEAVEAQKIIGELDAAYAAAAEKELETVLQSSRELAAKGQMATARSILNSVRRRFGEGPWYETRARARVEEALARIDNEEQERAKRVEVPGAASGPSLVLNGSMAEGEASPTHWKPWGAGIVTRDTVVFKSAPASLHVKPSEPGGKGLASQLVEGRASDWIRVTGTVRCKSQVGAQVAIQFFSPDWQRSNWEQLQHIQFTTDWIDFAKVLAVPEWAGRFTVVMLVEAGGEAWLDDLVVQRVEAGDE